MMLTPQPQPIRETPTWSRGLCAVCGVSVRDYGRGRGTFRTVCSSCELRMELEIDGEAVTTCQGCGRHPEICAITPCAVQAT